MTSEKFRVVDKENTDGHDLFPALTDSTIGLLTDRSELFVVCLVDLAFSS